MTAQSPDPLTWVSLGRDDVSSTDLQTSGHPWDDVVPDGVDIRIDPTLLSQMPRDGWREVTSFSQSAAPFEWRLLAAPNREGWALAHVADGVNGPVLTGDPGPYRVRPGRPTRRQGLELVWPEGLRCQASGLNSTTVNLRNSMDRQWLGDPLDGPYVHAWLLDRSGNRLSPGYFAYGPLGHLPTLLSPGESFPLPVDFGPSTAEIAPGTYGVEVVLTSLDLWGPRGTVEVT